MTHILHCDRSDVGARCPVCTEHFDYVYRKVAAMPRISLNDLTLEFMGRELITIHKSNGKRLKNMRAIRGENGCMVSVTYSSDTETKLFCACS